MSEALHKRPGYKRVPVTLVLHVYETVPEDWEDGGRFYVEENHCLDNYIRDMAATITKHEHPTKPMGICTTCCRGEAYLGHVPFALVPGIQPAADTFNENAKDYEADDRDPWKDERP